MAYFVHYHVTDGVEHPPPLHQHHLFAPPSSGLHATLQLMLTCAISDDVIYIKGSNTIYDMAAVVWNFVTWVAATVLAFGNGFAAGGGVASGSGGGAAAASETAAGAAVVLPVADESRPTTKISFKLANGGGTEQYTFNVSHTLADVYAVAAHLTSLSSSSESSGGGGAGVLFGGYPPKPLANDGGITIENAQIQGAALRQKLSPPPSKAKSE